MKDFSVANLNIVEAIVVFLGLQFAGYSTSRTIDELPIQANYRLLILWVITFSLLIPIALIKRKRNKINERQINQIATKIATEVTQRIKERIEIIQEDNHEGDVAYEYSLTTPINHPS
jgi:hypothetical protein